MVMQLFQRMDALIEGGGQYFNKKCHSYYGEVYYFEYKCQSYLLGSQYLDFFGKLIRCIADILRRTLIF